MHRAGLFPNSYDFDENGWPIEKRTAYHMSMSAEIINTFDQMYPDKPLKISGLPDAQRNDRQRPGGHPEVPGLRDSTGKVPSPGGPGSSIELK